MRSATMIVVTFVGTDGISGKIDASTTRNASTSRIKPQASTMADGSELALSRCRAERWVLRIWTRVGVVKRRGRRDLGPWAIINGAAHACGGPAVSIQN
jgi:hypothetical protein